MKRLKHHVKVAPPLTWEHFTPAAAASVEQHCLCLGIGCYLCGDYCAGCGKPLPAGWDLCEHCPACCTPCSFCDELLPPGYGQVCDDCAAYIRDTGAQPDSYCGSHPESGIGPTGRTQAVEDAIARAYARIGGGS